MNFVFHVNSMSKILFEISFVMNQIPTYICTLYIEGGGPTERCFRYSQMQLEEFISVVNSATPAAILLIYMSSRSLV